MNSNKSDVTLIPGQTLKEKRYLEKIKAKNLNREWLPRVYNEVDLKPSDE